MKKWLSIAFLTVSLFLLAMPAYASEESTATSGEVVVDITENYAIVKYGDKIVTCENEVIKEGDLTFLPLREVLEAYGAQLNWAEGEAETKVIITAGQNRCQLVLDLDKQVAYGLDKKEYALRHVDSTLYLPIHFFGEFVNCNIEWESEHHTLVLRNDQLKEAAVAYTSSGGKMVKHRILNLPVYEKTVAVARSTGGRQSISNGEIYETGVASYYGGRFHGRRTASGERYDKNAMTAAHKTLPFGTIVRVTAEWNQKSVDVRITDRGPYSKGRIIDLSTGAAAELGMLSKGVGTVSLEIVAWPK